MVAFNDGAEHLRVARNAQNQFYLAAKDPAYGERIVNDSAWKFALHKGASELTVPTPDREQIQKAAYF